MFISFKKLIYKKSRNIYKLFKEDSLKMTLSMTYLEVPAKVYRASPTEEKFPGPWTTPSFEAAKNGGYGTTITGYEFNKARILNMENPDNIRWLSGKLLVHGAIKAAKTLQQVFRIKENDDGEFVERDSTYEGDTCVLKALLDIQDDLEVDGFGAGELPMTDSELNFHPEICLFKPENFLVKKEVFHGTLEDASYQRLKRREGLAKAARANKKKRKRVPRSAITPRTIIPPSFEDSESGEDGEVPVAKKRLFF